MENGFHTSLIYVSFVVLIYSLPAF